MSEGVHMCGAHGVDDAAVAHVAAVGEHELIEQHAPAGHQNRAKCHTQTEDTERACF